MTYPGGNPFNQPDGNNLYSDEYAEASVRERRAHVGRSHGLELWVATAVAVVFVGWLIWAFLF